MTSFVHTGSTLLKHELSRIKSAIHRRKLRINIAYSSGEIKLWKFQWRHSSIPEVLSKKLFQHEICRIKSSIHWNKLRIYTAYSSGEIKLWKIQWRHSRIPEVLSKICCSMKYEEFSPLFICANCAYILRIAAEKLNFENFNDVICAYGKYFRKSFLALNMQNLILYSLAPTAHIYCL